MVEVDLFQIIKITGLNDYFELFRPVIFQTLPQADEGIEIDGQYFGEVWAIGSLKEKSKILLKVIEGRPEQVYEIVDSYLSLGWFRNEAPRIISDCSFDES